MQVRIIFLKIIVILKLFVLSLKLKISNFYKKNINKNNFDLISKAISSNHRNFEIEKKSDDPRSFRTIHSSKGDIESITVNKLLEKYNSQKYEPFIIKIDIEGHEKELFNENLEWIDKFKIIIIEPHDWLIPGKSIFNNFIKSISKLNRDFIILNENIVSIRNN